MTPAVRKLLDDADAAGLSVDETHNQFARISKRGGSDESFVVVVLDPNTGGFHEASEYGASGQQGEVFGTIKATRTALGLDEDSSS